MNTDKAMQRDLGVPRMSDTEVKPQSLHRRRWRISAVQEHRWINRLIRELNDDVLDSLS